jgi:hypothetical protein
MRLAHLAAAIAVAAFPVIQIIAPAMANDGFAGLPTGGLAFEKTDDIAMLEEDLFISEEEIRIRYLFENLSDEQIEAVVAFPLPRMPVDQERSWEHGFDGEVAHHWEFVGFETRINGEEVPVTLDKRAYMFGDTFGETPQDDVTDTLTRHGIPLTFHDSEVGAALSALDDETFAALREMRLVGGYERLHVIPMWWLELRARWVMTFPPGEPVEVTHRYRPSLGGAYFVTASHSDPRYCIGEAEQAVIDEILKAREEIDGVAMAGYATLHYVLTTANTWAGPIGRFRLTVETRPDDVAFFCMDGAEHDGVSTYTVEKHDFAPADDLHVLFLHRPRPYVEEDEQDEKP